MSSEPLDLKAMELKRDVIPPPCQALSIPPLNPDQKTQVVKALKALQQFERGEWSARAQSTQVELALVDEFMYKSQHRFRNDRGHRDTKRVLMCIRRALALKVDQLCRNFAQGMPLCLDVKRDRPRLFGPSREMLEFLLLRLWGFRALVERAQILAGLCGHKQLARIRLGHFWNVALQKLSSVARLWSNLTTILPQVADVYRALFELLEILPSSGIAFLAPGTKLPPWPISSSLEEEPMQPENVIPSESPVSKRPMNICEIGEVIERDVSSRSSSKCPTVSAPGITRAKWKRLGKILKSWAHPTDVQEFLSNETRQRKTDRPGCVTKALNQAQWKALKADLVEFMAGPKATSSKLVALVKQRLRFWLVRPDLTGQKPPDWEAVVKILENK